MNRTRQIRPNSSWQSARQKTINRLFGKPIGPYNATNWTIATDVSGRVMNALDQYGWVSPAAQQESNSSVIRQMVDIMGELGCQDLEELVFKYLIKLIEN